MNTHYLPMTSGDEVAAFTSERRALIWRPGERKAIKRRYSRRVRQDGRRICRIAKYS